LVTSPLLASLESVVLCRSPISVVSGALASADAQRIIDVALLAAFTGQHHRTGYFAPVGESFACQQ